jgi:hypothetical protein
MGREIEWWKRRRRIGIQLVDMLAIEAEAVGHRHPFRRPDSLFNRELRRSIDEWRLFFWRDLLARLSQEHVGHDGSPEE